MDEIALAGVADQQAVRSWLAAYAGHWDVDFTEAEIRGRVDGVARFCAFAGEEPDALVASLFRDTPEGPRIRAKRRKAVIALIEEFERSQGGDAREARRQANIVRSFLIHNGVAFSAGAMY
jgi:hypothetical protein